MALQRTRNAAAALALAGILCVAAPAHAARWDEPVAISEWIESALEWISRLWVGNDAAELKPALGKSSCGSDLEGCPSPNPNSDLGYGIDPNG